MFAPSLLFAAALAAPDALAQEKGGGDQKGRGKQPEWKSKPYLQGQLGGVSYNGNFTASLGVNGGLRYWQAKREDPYLRGVARGIVSYIVPNGEISGIEIRVGNFIGPWYKFIGASTGPDIFWNKYTYGNLVIDPSMGLGWPVIIDMGSPKHFMVFGGLQPDWYFNRDPAHVVDWSNEDQFGFGHEFSWLTGATIKLGKLKVFGTYVHKITAFGDQNTIGVGAAVKM